MPPRIEIDHQIAALELERDVVASVPVVIKALLEEGQRNPSRKQRIQAGKWIKEHVEGISSCRRALSQLQLHFPTRIAVGLRQLQRQRIRSARDELVAVIQVHLQIGGGGASPASPPPPPGFTGSAGPTRIPPPRPTREPAPPAMRRTGVTPEPCWPGNPGSPGCRGLR